MHAHIQMHPPVFALHQFHKSLNGTIVEIVSFLFSGRTAAAVQTGIAAWFFPSFFAGSSAALPSRIE